MNDEPPMFEPFEYFGWMPRCSASDMFAIEWKARCGKHAIDFRQRNLCIGQCAVDGFDHDFHGVAARRFAAAGCCETDAGGFAS